MEITSNADQNKDSQETVDSGNWEKVPDDTWEELVLTADSFSEKDDLRRSERMDTE